MCKKHFIQPKFGPQSLQKGDPKEVEKLLVEAGGHEKGSWGLMGERVKDTFGWWVGLRGSDFTALEAAKKDRDAGRKDEAVDISVDPC